MPPAVLAGPDGKPWHSWRVLFFPTSGTGTCSTSTISRSPGTAKNLRLLDRMPAVYHDPIHGDSPAASRTTRAGRRRPGPKLAGSNRPVRTAFAATGVKMKSVTILPSSGSLNGL